MEQRFEATYAYGLDVKLEQAKDAAIGNVSRRFWDWLMAQHTYPMPVTGYMALDSESVTAVLIACPEGGVE